MSHRRYETPVQRSAIDECPNRLMRSARDARPQRPGKLTLAHQVGEGQMELIHSGKIREVYADGRDVLLVASDRVSVYDVVLPTPIPAGKTADPAVRVVVQPARRVTPAPRHLRHRPATAVGRPRRALPAPGHDLSRVHRPRLPRRRHSGRYPALWQFRTMAIRLRVSPTRQDDRVVCECLGRKLPRHGHRA